MPPAVGRSGCRIDPCLSTSVKNRRWCRCLPMWWPRWAMRPTRPPCYNTHTVQTQDVPTAAIPNFLVTHSGCPMSWLTRWPSRCARTSTRSTLLATRPRRSARERHQGHACAPVPKDSTITVVGLVNVNASTSVAMAFAAVPAVLTAASLRFCFSAHPIFIAVVSARSRNISMLSLRRRPLAYAL